MKRGYVAAGSLSSIIAPYSELLEYNIRLFVDNVELDFESLFNDKLPSKFITENTSIIRLMLMVAETNILVCMELPEEHNLHYQHDELRIKTELSQYFYAQQYMAFLNELEKIDPNLSLSKGDKDKLWYSIEKKYDFQAALNSKINALLTKLEKLPSETVVGDIFPKLSVLQKQDKTLKERNTVNRLIDSEDIKSDATEYEDTEFFAVKDDSIVFKTGKLNMVTPSDIELMTVYRAFGVDFPNLEEACIAFENNTIYRNDWEIKYVDFSFQRATAAFDLFYIPAYGKFQLDDPVIRSEYYQNDEEYPFIPTEILFRCGIKNDVGKSILLFTRAIFSIHSKESIGEQLFKFITAISRHIDDIEGQVAKSSAGKILVLGSSCEIFKTSLLKYFPNDEFLFHDDEGLYL